MKQLTIDGVSVEVDSVAADVIQRALKDAEEQKKTDAERIKELEDELETLKAEKEKMDAEIETLKTQAADAQLTPDKLDAAVKQRGELIDSARKLKSDLVTDGKSEADIKREVVSNAMDAEKIKDWTDEQITASFNTLAASAPQSDADPYRQHLQLIDGGKPGELKGRDLYVDRLAHPEKYAGKE